MAKRSRRSTPYLTADNQMTRKPGAGGSPDGTLNERGIKTATGKPWSPVTVTRMRQRLGLI
jgi:hypothetical protein